ncbi:MAG: response regulator [Verrucomicrobiota bacterium]|nr:response regulator [Verrucomicrobiota bacterium]
MPCILYFDDDSTARMILHHLLEARGISVLEAGNGNEAWDALYKHPEIDLICLDHQLGGEMGWQWLTTLRGHPLLREVPVVVLTAQAEREDVLKYVGMGVLDFLLKRPDMQKLEQALSTAMGRTWRHRLFASEKRSINPGEMQDKVSLLDIYVKSEIHDESQKLLLEMHRSAHSSGSFILESLIMEAMRSIQAKVPMAMTKSIGNLVLYGRLMAYIEGVDKRPARDTGAVAKIVPGGTQATGKPDDFVLTDWQVNEPLARAQIGAFYPADVESRLLTLLATPRWKRLERIVLDNIMGIVRVELEPREVLKAFPSMQLLLSSEASSGLTAEARKLITVPDITGRFGAERMNMAALMPTLLADVSKVELDWWLHAFATGWMAAELRYQTRLVGPLNLPLLGLLHDMGKIMFADAFPYSYRLVWTLSRNERTSIHLAETALFGMNHAEAMVRWLELIGHPGIATAVGWHGDPLRCPAANITQDLRFLRAADLMMRDTGRAQPTGLDGTELDEAYELMQPIWPVFQVVDLKHRLKDIATRSARIADNIVKASRNQPI